MNHFITNARRSIAAIVFGIVLFAAMFVAIVTFVSTLGEHFQSIDWGWVADEVEDSIFPVTLAFAALLCLVGVPLWLPLHFTRRRHWLFALLLGAVLFFVAWFGPHTRWFSMPLSGDGYDSYGWGDAAWDALLAALLGAVIAGAMWRVAYRKTRAP